MEGGGRVGGGMKEVLRSLTHQSTGKYMRGLLK